MTTMPHRRLDPMPEIDDMTLVGIHLPGYAGISVWQHPDGSYENRWNELRLEHPDSEEVAGYWRAAAEWIAAQPVRHPA